MICIKTQNPSRTVIYKIGVTLNMKISEFYNFDLCDEIDIFDKNS
jgi:hypothetical protein